MLKYLALIVCSACVALVIAEVSALGLLWHRGLLTAHHLREIRLVMTGDPEAAPAPDETPADYPSGEDLARARAIRVLNFDKRESELTTLKRIADENREELDRQQALLSAQRKKFEDDLRQLDEQQSAAGVEQARGVLLALPAKDAMRQLMQLSTEENVVILKGMPEKTVARILKEFQAAPAASKSAGDSPAADGPAERGRRIFEALSRGEPQRSLTELSLDRARVKPVEPAN